MNLEQKSILDFHLAHRTNSEFSFQPNENTSKLVWKYLSTSNLLPDLTNIEITEEDKISVIEKATHYKIYSEKELFEHYKKLALGKGFLLVSSTPLTRSSFHADDDFIKLKEARRKVLDAQKNVNKKGI